MAISLVILGFTGVVVIGVVIGLAVASSRRR